MCKLFGTPAPFRYDCTNMVISDMTRSSGKQILQKEKSARTQKKILFVLHLLLVPQINQQRSHCNPLAQ